MAIDPIESALKKGDAKFEQLQAKTMPFYDKMQQGKFSKSDLKKLKQLYQEQSKVAAKTFEESSKAVEKNARTAARSIVSKSISNKELLNAKELSVILNSAFSKAFQKSADQVKQAVDEAIQGQLEDIKATLDQIQQQMLSEQEVISHIRELMLPSFSALAQIENPDFETLLDPRVRRRFLKKREKSLADEIVTRTVKAIIGYDKLKEEQRTGQFKKRKTSWYNPFSYVTGTVSQLKDLYRRQKFERQFGKLDTVEELGDAYNAMSKKKSKLGQFFESASAAKQFAQSVLFNLSQYNFSEGKIRHGIRPGMGASLAFSTGYGNISARNISSNSSPIARLTSYTANIAKAASKAINKNKKRVDRIERFSVESTRQRMREFLQMDEWSQTKSNLQSMLGYYLNPFKSISAKIYKIAKDQYIDRLRAKAKSDKEQAKVQEFIKNTRSIEQNSQASGFATRKFEKLREIILSDVKKQWVFNIKNTAAQYYKKVKDRVTKSKAFDKTKSFLKTLGLVYIGAQIINFLQSTMPGWREKVISAIGTGLSEGFKFLANFFLDSLGTILKGTALFMRDNADLIASIILKVVGHVVKAIVDAVFALLFGEKVNPALEETNQQQQTDINTWTKTDQYKQLVDEAAPYYSTRAQAAAAIQNYMSNRGSTQGLAEGFNDVPADSATSVLPQELINKLSSIKNQYGWESGESTINALYAKDKAEGKIDENAVAANSIITSSQKGSAADAVTVNSVDVKSPQEKYNEKKQRDQILAPVTQNPASLSANNEPMPQASGTSSSTSDKGMPIIPNKSTSPDLSLLNGGLLLGDA